VTGGAFGGESPRRHKKGKAVGGKKEEGAFRLPITDFIGKKKRRKVNEKKKEK